MHYDAWVNDLLTGVLWGLADEMGNSVLVWGGFKFHHRILLYVFSEGKMS